MPELVGSYTMEGGKLSFSQQKIDAGGDIPLALEKYGKRFLSYSELGSIDLPEGSSFHMRCQL